MPEIFDRYRRFEKDETTPLIDAHVIFLKGFTKKEVFIGLMGFVLGMYLTTVSLYIGLAILLVGGIAPHTLKTMREKLPKNIFAHALWYLGLWKSGLPDELQRPQKTYLTL